LEDVPDIKLNILNIMKPYSLFENFVYWSDWETKSIHRCHKYSGQDCQNVTSLAHKPMDIKVVHPLLQPSSK